MVVSDLINRLESLRAQHGNMKVFCRDMEQLVVEVVDAQDKEQYGDKFLYLSNGYFG